MGIIRKTTSIFSAGAVDFRSDKERTAAYTKGARKQARKQTKLIKGQVKQQAKHNEAMEAQAALSALSSQRPTQAPPPLPPASDAGEAEPTALMRLKQEREEIKRNPPPGSLQDHVNRWRAKKAATVESVVPVVPQAPPAGWYPDQVDPTLVRWFDGVRWTEHTQNIRS